MVDFRAINVVFYCDKIRLNIPCGGGHRGRLPQYQARLAQLPGPPDGGRGCSLSVEAAGI